MVAQIARGLGRAVRAQVGGSGHGDEGHAHERARDEALLERPAAAEGEVETAAAQVDELGRKMEL